VYVLLPVSDSGSGCHLPSLGRQYGGFDARTRFLLHPSHATWSEVFFIVIGALRLSTMTFARGSSLADTELPSVWSANLTLPDYGRFARYPPESLVWRYTSAMPSQGASLS
jgi:hypothetical protein